MKIVILLISVLATFFCPFVANAEIATDAKMADEALLPYVRAKNNPAARDQRLGQIRQSLSARAASAPGRLVSGHVILSNGHTVAELSNLASNHQIEIYKIHIKTPYNDRGVIQSIDIGDADLSRYRGTFQQRAERAIAAMRYNFLKWSEGLPPEDAEAHRRVAYSTMLIYRIEAYGTAQSMSDLFDVPSVAAVVAHSPDRSKANVAGHKNLVQRSNKAWARFDANRPEQD